MAKKKKTSDSSAVSDVVTRRYKTEITFVDPLSSKNNALYIEERTDRLTGKKTSEWKGTGQAKNRAAELNNKNKKK